MPRRTIKVQPFKTPPADHDEFDMLYTALTQAFGSRRAAARAMQISYPTWTKYKTKPPSWPWYTLVMQQVLRARLRGMKIDRKSRTSQIHYQISQTLGKDWSYRELLDEIEAETLVVHDAMDHIRKKLSVKGMYFDELSSARHAGGHSGRQLRRAARKLGVRMKQEGYGDEKRSYWRLPTIESDEDDGYV